MLTALRRIPQVRDLIEQQAYFVVHAPRQVGKTTFLHRVENGGGVLNREYAVRRGRIDLCLRLGPDRVAMELKVWRDGGKDPRPQGLRQLDGYLAGRGLDSGWLIVFDQRTGLPPIEDRTRSETMASPSGRRITVIYA